MKHTPPTGADQGCPTTLRCTGCGATILAHQPCTRVRAPSGATGLVCSDCTLRAERSSRFAAQVENCILAGVLLPDVERTFVKLGIFDVPVSPLECGDACGLPLATLDAELRAQVAAWGARA